MTRSSHNFIVITELAKLDFLNVYEFEIYRPKPPTLILFIAINLKVITAKYYVCEFRKDFRYFKVNTCKILCIV